MKSKGILLNTETGDIQINVIRDASGLIMGGFVVGDVTQQNQATIIMLHPAELKRAPTIGVGLSSIINSHETLLYKHKVREQLEADGQHITYMDIVTTSNGKIDIQINANY